MNKFTQNFLLFSGIKDANRKLSRLLFSILFVLPWVFNNNAKAQDADTVLPFAWCKNINVSLSPGGGCGGERVLLLWDVINAHTLSLKNAIQSAGYVVTMPAVPEYQWDGTNPALDEFAAVIHLNGTTYNDHLSLTAQNALVDFVLNKGKAFIHNEWDANNVDWNSSQITMEPIIIIKRVSATSNFMNYTKVPVQASHPILSGLPESFSFYAGANIGPVRTYATNPATAIMTDQNGSAAVAVRDFGAGRVVGFNHAGNYSGSGCLSDANVQRLYINALAWATHRGNSCATITASQVNNGSTDNDGIAAMTVSPSYFTCADAGPNVVTLTVTDSSGNASSCQAVVMVQDITPPVAHGKNITVSLNSMGTVEVFPYQINQGSSDECGIDNLALNKTNFTCDDILTNPNPVVLTVTDIHGNASSCTAMVTVVDNNPPAVICQDVIIPLDATGNAVINASQVDNGSNDACGIAGMSLNKTYFTCDDILTNPNPVVLTVTDIHGNASSCTAMVTVVDSTPPAVICQDVSIILDATGNAGINASQVDNGSNDACGIAGMSLNKTNFTCDDILTNPNPVVLTVTDIHGNASSCTAMVTVVDSTPPAVICQDVSIILDATGNAGINASQVDNGSNDACGIAGMSLNKTNFTCDDILTNPNPVVLTVTDIHGNASSCTAMVTVVDNKPPAVICQDVIIPLDATGNAGINASQVDNGSNDACGIAGMSLNKTNFTCDDILTNPNPVVLTVTDIHGNASSCTAMVTVVDNTPPAVICQDVIIPLDATGNASINASQVDNGSNDACGISHLAISKTDFTCADMTTNPNPVILTVTDINNNIATCTALVTVEDHVVPTFTRPADITVYTGMNCTYDISVSNTGDVTDEWDNCQALQAVYSDVYAEGNCAVSHVITRTWSLMDVNGNTALAQQQIITVVDTIAPAFTAPSDFMITSAAYNAFGADVTLTGDVIDEWDNCSMGLQAVFTDVMLPGSNIINRIWHLVDDCGNAASDQLQVITITDTRDYVILAKERVVMKKSTLYSGGVGVKKLGGKIEVRDNSFITAPGTYAEGDNIVIDGTSAVADVTTNPAVISWPAFQPMPYIGTQSVHVPNNVTVYLNDTLYKEIIVGTNATVVFTKPVVNIDKRFDIGDRSTVKFEQCGVLRIDDKMILHKNVTINPDTLSVWFYINQTMTVAEGAHVNGFFCLGRHNTPDTIIHDLIIADSKPTNPAVFNGIFMAKSVFSGKHTNWYLNTDFDACPAVPAEDDIFTCPPDMIICYEDSAFNLLNMMRPHKSLLQITNDQPAVFPVGTIIVTWTVIYENGYVYRCTQKVTRSGKISTNIILEGLFCAGGQVRLTANVTGMSAISYLWSTEETGPSINVTASGDYVVAVNNFLGCYAEDSITISVDTSDLLSAYVMLARDRIELKRSTVNSGGLGVMKLVDGRVEIKESSLVTATGTFARAAMIPIDAGSSLAVPFNMPSTALLPVFEANPYPGIINVAVADNATVTLNDSVYKDVKIGKNADVTFGSGIVNIGGCLTIGDGATLHFSPCAKIRIRGAGYPNGIIAGQLVNVNPEDVPLIIYVQNHVTFKKGARVWGKLYLGKPSGIDYSLNTEDSRTVRSNIFTGVFIAKEIISAQNSYWNHSVNCGGCANLKSRVATEAPVSEVLLQNYPNPFSKATEVMFVLPEESWVTLTVYDISGKQLDILYEGMADKGREYLVPFDGGNLSAGVYIYRMTTATGVYNCKMVLGK